VPREARRPGESCFVATIETPTELQPFEHLMLDFLAYLEFERGLSRNTLEAYRSDLLQYGRFLDARSVSALAAGSADVADFLADLAQENDRPAASAATIHRKAACLRSFYRHLCAVRACSISDHHGRAQQRRPQGTHSFRTCSHDDEVNRLLSQPQRHRPAGAARSARCWRPCTPAA